MSFTTSKIAAAVFLVSGLAISATASAGIALNTTGLKANAVQTFSVGANGSAAAAGITFGALGTTTRLPDVEVTGSGRPTFVQSYNLPVTKADISVGWDLKITANSGESSGAGLRISSAPGGDTALANFVVDFNKKTLFADFIDIVAKTTKPKQPIYSFVEVEPQKISFNNLVLNQTVKLGQLVFVPTAPDLLGDALLLDPTLREPLKTLDWGTIAIQVTSYARSPKISNAPLTLDKIPASAP